MRNALRHALALAVATLAVLTPAVPVLAQSTNSPLVVTYRDDDGTGRMTIQDLGPDAATGGQQIKVQLQQNGVTYNGSGITYQLEDQMPFTTLITFTLVAPSGRSFVFQGKTASGITFSGQGTYHRTSFPEQKSSWSIVLGG